jgi:UDP-N-acetylglucosamine 2-epimerase (non-hydrolysing)
MATSIVAQKAGIRVAHVEAGIRSGDWSMPEEINRRVTDSITNWFFTTSRYANENLIGEGVAEENIYFVGNTMIDTLLANTDRFHAPEFWNKFDLKKREYFVLTMHRPANVDESCALITMLATISVHSRGLPIIFPVHPRTAKSLKEVDNLPKNLLMVEPQSYLRFNYLVKNSFAVITDSGGITEEATVMGIPCMTLRDTTERPETIHTGTNELVGTNPENLAPYMKKLFEGNWKKGNIPEKWDGKTGQRIVSILERLLLDETP